MSRYFYVLTMNLGDEIKTLTGFTNNTTGNPKEIFDSIMLFGCQQFSKITEDVTVLYYYVTPCYENMVSK